MIVFHRDVFSPRDLFIAELLFDPKKLGYDDSARPNVARAYNLNMEADVKCHIYYAHKLTLPLQLYTQSREDKDPLLRPSILK